MGGQVGWSEFCSLRAKRTLEGARVECPLWLSRIRSSIPGLAQWVKEPLLLRRRLQMWLRSGVAVVVAAFSSNSTTPGLELPYSTGAAPPAPAKKEKGKKEGAGDPLLVEFLLCARHCAGCLMHVAHLILTNNSLGF